MTKQQKLAVEIFRPITAKIRTKNMYDDIEIFRDTESNDFKKIDIKWKNESFKIIVDDDYTLCMVDKKLVYQIDDSKRIIISATKEKPNVLLRMAEAIAYTIEGRFPKII